LSEDDSKTFATLPLGNYKLTAQKTVDDKKFDGHLAINMSDDNEVQEQFNEKYLDINIDDSELDSDTTVDLYINNKKMAAEANFEKHLDGPYQFHDKIVVYAQADVDEKTFKSSVLKVAQSYESNDPVSVDLSFDNDKVKSHQ